jgi:hypothetical protein
MIPSLTTLHIYYILYTQVQDMLRDGEGAGDKFRLLVEQLDIKDRELERLSGAYIVPHNCI